ncbi:MAG: DUF4421 family protein [Bacteroidetes bacterium]|nr:DUF4421 family protein [Bacteroidota bacterium]
MIVLLWVLCAPVLRAQGTHTAVAPFDTNYVSGNKEGLTVRTRLGRISQQWAIVHRQGKAPDINYNVNLLSTFGGHVAYNGLGLGFYLLPNEARNNPERYGYSRRLDLSLDFVRHRWCGAFVFNRTSGFYLPNPGAFEVPVVDTLPPQLRPDMHAQMLAAEYMYVFNHRRYSLRAQLNQTNVQRKSAGSWLLKIQVGQSRVWADSSLIPPQVDSLFPSVSGFTQATFSNIHVSPGYAHTFVIARRFAISPFLLLGIGYQRQYLAGSGGEIRKGSLYLATEPRLTLNYSRPRWFAGFLVYARLSANIYEEMQLVANLSGAQLYVGYRFPHFRLLPNNVFLRRIRPLRKWLDGD